VFHFIFVYLTHHALWQIDYRQLGYLLGLMGQAQRGEPLDMGSIGAHSGAPTIYGL
jgi:hypothetical protein